jgi:hypothetical protein
MNINSLLDYARNLTTSCDYITVISTYTPALARSVLNHPQFNKVNINTFHNTECFYGSDSSLNKPVFICLQSPLQIEFLNATENSWNVSFTQINPATKKYLQITPFGRTLINSFVLINVTLVNGTIIHHPMVFLTEECYEILDECNINTKDYDDSPPIVCKYNSESY